VLTTASYLVLYYSFAPLLGWPSEDKLPRRFDLVAVYVQEPKEITGAKGDIFFWALDRDRGVRQGTPRAYVVPFTAKLHAQVKEAGRRLRKNIPQVGETEIIDKDKPGRHGVPRDGSRFTQKSQKLQVKFWDATPEAPPPKGDVLPSLNGPSASGETSSSKAPPSSTGGEAVPGRDRSSGGLE
jgi:hypothetical protein